MLRINTIHANAPIDVNVLIQYCTLFRRLCLMYGLLAVLMLFLGVDALAYGGTNTITKVALSLYILQAFSYISNSFCLYGIGKWINISILTKNQILLALVCVSISILLIIIRSIFELTTTTNNRNNDDDEYGDQSLQSFTAWVVVSFLLILMFNCISFRFLYLFYLKLESFQEVARNSPQLYSGNIFNQTNPVVAMANRPVVTEAYVSNSPFAAQQGQVVQGQVVQGQVVGVHGSSPMAVPVHSVHVNSFTPHNTAV